MPDVVFPRNLPDLKSYSTIFKKRLFEAHFIFVKVEVTTSFYIGRDLPAHLSLISELA